MITQMVYMNLLKQTHGYQETFKHFNVCTMLCIRFRSINNELYRLKHANLIIHYWTRSNLCSKYQQIIHLEFLLYRYICGDALVLFEICKEHNYYFCVWHNFPKIHFKDLLHVQKSRYTQYWHRTQKNTELFWKILSVFFFVSFSFIQLGIFIFYCNTA